MHYSSYQLLGTLKGKKGRKKVTITESAARTSPGCAGQEGIPKRYATTRAQHADSRTSARSSWAVDKTVVLAYKVEINEL